MNKSMTAWPKGQMDANAGKIAPVVPAIPSGKQPQNEAEELLSTAVAWWDAKYYTEGDRWLRNRGTGGSALDARLGSSTTPNSNDPLYLKPEDSGYVYLPGVSGNSFTLSDENALDITGDIDIRVKVALDDWTPSAQNTLVSKWGAATTDASYEFDVDSGSTGKLKLWWSVTGDGSTSAFAATSTVAPTVTDGASLWVRATLDVNDGLGGRVTTFYTSDDGLSWTQLGNPVTGSATSIYSGSSTVKVGVTYNGSPLSGRVYRAQVLNGINGTTVLDINCDTDIPSAEATSFTCSTGQTVTVNRATSGRKTVVMPSKTKGGSPVFLLGTDDYFEVVGRAQDRMLNLNADDSITVLATHRKWHFPTQQCIIQKLEAASATVAPGWKIANFVGTPTNVHFEVGYAAANYTPTGIAMSAGVLTTVTGLRDMSISRLKVTVDGKTYSTVQSSTAYSAANQKNVQIGYTGSSGTYTDGEFTAAAIFRRSLTDREIKLINDYYQNRVKPQTWVDPTDAAQKTFLASKLGISEATYSDALDILKSADFYVDSRSYDGSNYWKNLGKRGAALNMRLGSTQTSDSNDPKYLAPETRSYVYLPTPTAGYNTLWVPYDNSYQVTTGVAFTVSGRTGYLPPSSERAMFSTKVSAANPGFEFVTSTNGTNRTFTLYYGTLSGSWNSVYVTVATDPLPNGGWWKVEVDTSNPPKATFYYAPHEVNEPTSWTQAGTQQTFTAGGVYDVSASNPTVGARAYTSTSEQMTGNVYRVIYKKSGVTLIDIDCDVLVDGRQTSFQALTGQTVTIYRGSSGLKSVVVPNTTVKTMDAANVYLPGVSGNYLSVPDPGATTQPPVDLVFDGPFLWLEKDGVTLPNEQQSVSLDITGDIDIQCKVALDDWTPGALSNFVSKWSPNNQSYWFGMNTNGTLWFASSTTGSNQALSISSTSTVPITDGTPLWVRTTCDVDNGASGNTVRFYYSFDGDSWTTLGNPVVSVGTTSIFSSNSAIRMGQGSDVNPYNLYGRIYRAIVKDGLAGTTVLDADCSVITSSSQSSFTAATGQTVTINSTANSGLRVNPLKTGAGVPVFLFGTDDYMEMEGSTQHDTFFLDQSTPFTAIFVCRAWPTITNGHTMLLKGNSTSATFATSQRWFVYFASGSEMNAFFDDGTAFTKVRSNAVPVGRTSVFAQTLSPTTITNYFNRAIAAGTGSRPPGKISTSETLKICYGYAGYYGDYELMAVIITKNTLTAEQVSTITTFFGA